MTRLTQEGRESFRQRNNTVDEQPPTPRDEVPEWLRREVAHKIEALVGEDLSLLTYDRKTLVYEAFRPWIWKILNRAPVVKVGQAWVHSDIEETFAECQWDEFYELCELTFTLLYQRARFQNEVNELFGHEVMAWHFEEGEIVPTRPVEISEIFEEVKGLLSDPMYLGPNEQFRKANQHLSKRPEPDTQNCVKDAVGALEGVAQKVTQQPKQTLGGLLSNGYLIPFLPTQLHGVVERLWAYRSDEPGVGHANTGTSTVGFEEAEWVLAMCATSMVFLVKKEPSAS